MKICKLNSDKINVVSGGNYPFIADNDAAKKLGVVYCGNVNIGAAYKATKECWGTYIAYGYRNENGFCKLKERPSECSADKWAIVEDLHNNYEFGASCDYFSQTDDHEVLPTV